MKADKSLDREPAQKEMVSIFNEMDYNITKSEIANALKKLKVVYKRMVLDQQRSHSRVRHELGCENLVDPYPHPFVYNSNFLFFIFLIFIYFLFLCHTRLYLFH